MSLPDEEAAFLGVDLDTIAGFSPDHLTVVKAWQCDLLRKARVAAYVDAGVTPEQWMNADLDGNPTKASLTVLRNEVKAVLPWPGAYR